MADLEAMIAALWEDARPRLLERVEALQAAWDAGDRKQAAAEAHTLAGTLGTFGRTEASEAAREAERAIEDGDGEAVTAATAKLRGLVG